MATMPTRGEVHEGAFAAEAKNVQSIHGAKSLSLWAMGNGHTSCVSILSGVEEWPDGADAKAVAIAGDYSVTPSQRPEGR